MCGRFILAQRIEKLTKRFNVTLPNDVAYTPLFNIAPGDKTLVVTSNDNSVFQSFTFGLTPFWASKRMYLFNARAEGDRNKQNEVGYRGSLGIINKPAFRKAIRSQRCLVPADAFIEGSDKNGLSDPYLVYLRDKVRPFSFAGIWDRWTNAEVGEEIYSFSIITTVANSLLQKIPHHRSPVILQQWQESKWLNLNTPLSEITAMLQPYSSELMNAYPIAPEIKNARLKNRSLINPVGNPLMPEDNASIALRITKTGFGRRKIM
ncbi:MAG: SOS response-associated peptidase [Salinivirgaceae bacterium]